MILVYIFLEMHPWIEKMIILVYAHDSDSDFDEPYENRYKLDLHVLPAVKYENCSAEESYSRIIRPW